MRSACDKVNGQRLFRTVTIQHPFSGKEYGLERKPTVTLGKSGRVLLFPRSASDEKTAPVAASRWGRFPT